MKTAIATLALAAAIGSAHAQNTPQSVDSLIDRAVEWRLMGNPREAASILTRLLDDEPSQRLVYELAAAHFDMGNTTLAQSQTERAARMGGDYTYDAELLSARCRELHGFTSKARKTYLKLLSDKRYTSGKAGYYYARMLYNSHKSDEAVEQLQRSILTDRTLPEAHLLLATIMAERGERFHSMLPLYYFLLISDDFETKTLAYKQLVLLWKHSGQPWHPLSPKPRLASFDEKVETMIAVISPNDSLSVLTGAQAIEGLYDRTRQLFEYLLETSENNLDFWQVVYTDFFVTLLPRNFLLPYIYHISNDVYHTEVLTWIAQNPYLFNEFSLWMEAQ